MGGGGRGGVTSEEIRHGGGEGEGPCLLLLHEPIPLISSGGHAADSEAIGKAVRRRPGPRGRAGESAPARAFHHCFDHFKMSGPPGIPGTHV